MRLLVPFFDDSTLIFATRMRELAARRGWQTELPYFLDKSGEGTLSERQMALHNMPMSAPLPAEAFLPMLEGCDAILACRVPAFVSQPLKSGAYVARRDRPCFIAFQPGLEFTPQRGFRNRALFDTVFLNAADHLEIIGARDLAAARTRDLRYGHPYFLKPPPQAQARGRNIYFFAQAISPVTRRSREHLIDVLIAIAEANPDRDLVLKLRHLPHENALHVHKENHAYPDLIEARGEAMPPNLRYSACSMEEALEDAALCLTCTSTAAMDAVSQGIPTLVYTSYVDYWKDRMSAAMEREFEGSGLLASLSRVLRLEARPPRSGWLDARFVTPDGLLDDIEAAIARVRRGGP